MYAWLTSWNLHAWLGRTDLTNTFIDTLSYLSPTTINLLQAVEWSKQRFLGPGLQVYALATPLNNNLISQHHKKRKIEKQQWANEMKELLISRNVVGF